MLAGTGSVNTALSVDPPPWEWSILKYGSSGPKEDHDAQEATHPRRDRGQVAPGGRPGRTRNPCGGGNPRDRRHRGRLRDELPDGEIFYSLQEARVVIESWRRHYNTVRPHASLGYKPPAPEVFVPAFAA